MSHCSETDEESDTGIGINKCKRWKRYLIGYGLTVVKRVFAYDGLAN